LRSVYSFKLYELIKSSEYLGKWEIGLTDLKEMLDVEDKYKHYGSFKLKILNQAQKDLTECCDVTFTYEEKTIRKKVERLLFLIKKNQPTKTAKNARKSEESAPNESGRAEAAPSVDTDTFDKLFSTYYLQLKDYGISATTLTQWLNTYPVAHIEACVKDFLDKSNKGKLRITEKSQQGGYLRRLIEQADFTETKEPKRTKHTTAKTDTAAGETPKQQKIKTQLAKEAAIIADILTKNPTLEAELLALINRRDGTDYSLADIQKYPFLPSKIGVIVKQRFPERFEGV
jgi:Initiator Replication protein